MNKTIKLTTNLLLLLSWLLNLAALLGYILLRRRIASPLATDNRLRFFIIRPYKTDADTQGRPTANERDELKLMARLFATAQGYGNAQVVVVTNHNDLGLHKIRQLAIPYGITVRVLEAPPMPPETVSGQLFNQKVAWNSIEGEVRDEDILLSTDCDSDLTLTLLRQVAKAYEDERVGGVGSYPLYHPAVNWAAMPLSNVINNGLGFLALDTEVRGFRAMVGNLLSMRVSVYRAFGGYDSYNRTEQMVDDMATSKKVLSTGKELRQVGMIPVYNRYSTWPVWWERWSRWAVSMKLAVPDIFWTAPLPTYGGQTLTVLLLGYAAVTRKPRFGLPFVANWLINFIYASLTGIWREALFSPISALLNMAGWFYALFASPRSLKWRGTVIKLEQEGDDERA